MSEGPQLRLNSPRIQSQWNRPSVNVDMEQNEDQNHQGVIQPPNQDQDQDQNRLDRIPSLNNITLRVPSPSQAETQRLHDLPHDSNDALNPFDRHRLKSSLFIRRIAIIITIFVITALFSILIWGYVSSVKAERPPNSPSEAEVNINPVSRMKPEALLASLHTRPIGGAIPSYPYRPNPNCPKMCTREYFPLCGTDGMTYSNKCMLNIAACESGRNIQVQYVGVCNSNLSSLPMVFDDSLSTEETSHHGEVVSTEDSPQNDIPTTTTSDNRVNVVDN